MALAMCVDGRRRCLFAIMRLTRFDAIDARQLLYGFIAMPIVSQWQGKRATIFGLGLVGPAAAECGSIRGPSRSSSRSKSRSPRQAASRHSIDVIARQTGFADRYRMRRAFLRAFGQPPQVIRRNAQAELAA
jgi:AraC-like DNA-binding protein